MSVEFSSEEHIKHACKEHLCDLCGNVIEKGSSYLTHACKVEGCFQYDCYHHECAQMIRFDMNSSGENIYFIDGVNDTITAKFCWACQQFEECELSFVDCEKILKGIGYERSEKNEPTKNTR